MLPVVGSPTLHITFTWWIFQIVLLQFKTRLRLRIISNSLSTFRYNQNKHDKFQRYTTPGTYKFALKKSAVDSIIIPFRFRVQEIFTQFYIIFKIKFIIIQYLSHSIITIYSDSCQPTARHSVRRCGEVCCSNIAELLPWSLTHLCLPESPPASISQTLESETDPLRFEPIVKCGIRHTASS